MCGLVQCSTDKEGRMCSAMGRKRSGLGTGGYAPRGGIHSGDGVGSAWNARTPSARGPVTLASCAEGPVSSSRMGSMHATVTAKMDTCTTFFSITSFRAFPSSTAPCGACVVAPLARCRTITKKMLCLRGCWSL